MPTENQYPKIDFGDTLITPVFNDGYVTPITDEDGNLAQNENIVAMLATGSMSHPTQQSQEIRISSRPKSGFINPVICTSQREIFHKQGMFPDSDILPIIKTCLCVCVFGERENRKASYSHYIYPTKYSHPKKPVLQY